MTAPESLRWLPSVHKLVEILQRGEPRFPAALLAREARLQLERARGAVIRGETSPTIDALADAARVELRAYGEASLRPVINATGVVLHTNLGRAPLGAWNPVAGYSNLEYDLKTGRRGRRDDHVSRLLEALLDRPAIVVNNGAAATFLALQELAAGGEVIVSRGELIEIGGGFRIPDILERSGAKLREVGTTNRTRIEDYAATINADTRLLLRVHPSNFHMTGFTGRPQLSELCALGRERGIPVYEDLGSGNLADFTAFGIREPMVSESLRAGVDLVSFSGDKLLGGPQAGILAGCEPIVARLRKNPLFRALRVDKFILQALEQTLRCIVLEDWDGAPALLMIRQSAGAVGERARNLFPELELRDGESVIGGGSTPDQSIPTVLVIAARTGAAKVERELRAQTIPVIARIENDQLLLDLRTVFAEEEAELRRAVMRVPGTCLQPY